MFAGSRYRVFYDFGFVSLDISTMRAEDSGVYTCWVRNSLGEAYSQAQVNCTAKSAILSATCHPASVDRIVQLETPKVQAEAKEEVILDAPKFVKLLPTEVQVKEGQTVHFECQLIPADDPNLKVVWLFNNRQLESASRIQIANDFGFVSMNMLYVYPEDSGVYTCLARNKNGEASCSCTLFCASRSSMQLDSYHPDSLKRIEELERPLPKPEVPEELCVQKPSFTALLPSGFDNLIEGQTLHLECQVEPMGDPKLRIEWLFNDQPLPASHRLRMVHELGYVALEILYVYPEDSGKYTCRAINDNGVCETVSYLKCYGRHHIITESHQPESWRKIKLMEESQPAVSKEVEVPMGKPSFVQELTGPTSLKEGQSVHMHCQVEPSNDPKLKISWLFNGIPLKEGSRFRTMCDFGCVSLEVLYVYPEDTGTYTCVARNEQGEVHSSLAIECRPLRSLYLESQHQDSWQQIQQIEAPPEPRPPSPERQFQPPAFTQPLVSVENLKEGDNVRLECRLEPADDPSMKIVWTRNGQPIPQGSRFRPTHDFNYVALEILTIYADDSGVYSCKATSAFGSAVTSCTIKCQASSSLLLETQHEDSWQKIQEIEMKPVREEIVEEVVFNRPTFVIPLKEYPPVMEGASIHLECQAEPQNDPNMVIEWYHNNRLLASGHRFRAVHDFGYISLDILYCFPEDSGQWSCKARNKAGVAETSVQLQIASKSSIILDPNHPSSWQKIQEIEAPKAPAPAPSEVAYGAPTFTQQLENVERHEGMPVHFECRLTPVNDARLRVEWLYNDKPLRMSNRMKMTFDFGYAALDIAYANAEDSGTYKCRAISPQGKAETSATLVVAGKTDLLLDTQHPESWAKIREIESRRPEEKMEVVEQPVQPKFIEQLSSCPDIIEGQPAHFEALLEPFNDSSLKVLWLHNNKPIQASSRIVYRYDFGIVTLDILYCFPEDSGEYVCRATNKLGTASSSATLQCAARSSIYRDTLHQESLRKIEMIEAPREAPPAVEMPTFQKPVFTQSLQNIDSLQEGQTAVFECRLIPINDPKLQVQWYFNDKPLQFSNRIMATQDFGCIQLVLKGVIASDSGVYMCRAINDLGESVNTASLVVEAKGNILSQSQHPESYRKVQLIESLDKFPKQEIPEAVFDKPVIVTSLQNYEDLNEGETLHLECQVTPVNDPNLCVEWLLNGKPLPKASRYRLGDDFGFRSLDIDDLKPLDSGVYTCRVSNLKGEAAASAVVKVKGYESVYLESHHPTSWQKIQDIENKPKMEIVEEVQPVQKPQIIETLKDYDNLPEGSTVHLEALCQPEKDNTMVVQWFRNNQPIMASQLVRTDYELGVATLDIVKAYAHHSGMYTVRLRNSAGEAASSCTVKILAKNAVVSDTQHESSWRKIQTLEAAKPEAPLEPEKVYPPPQFTAHLNDVTVIEGEPSHFECQVRGVKYFSVSFSLEEGKESFASSSSSRNWHFSGDLC
ncbi:unnamed protein product [Soboliphyme baturini]|uniref:Ig-like domain-containing protein n=1 Tax=Soboliphyme baturini TaxID=241478 RepID=A0A183IX94_9BILA|nr:unnamed protein product [Soboliphyme baturini]